MDSFGRIVVGLVDGLTRQDSLYRKSSGNRSNGGGNQSDKPQQTEIPPETITMPQGNVGSLNITPSGQDLPYKQSPRP